MLALALGIALVLGGVCDLIAQTFPVLRDAVTHMASIQIRNVATVAGNIVSAAPSADGC